MRYLMLALSLILLTPLKAKAGDVYVGAGASMLLFDRTVQTPIGKFVDQGGDAPALRIFAGYDHVFESRFFLGGELLAGVTAGRSRLLAAGQDFTVEIPFYTEAVLRAGWRTRGNAAFFARLGVMTAQMEEGGRSNWRAAPLVGLGAEVPIYGRFFAGVDVSWSELNRVEVWQAGFRVGYRF